METWEKNWIDYYQIFELPIDATAEEIKKRYHAILKEIHPDNENGSEELTALLNEAYSILSDVEKRRKYDEAYMNKQNSNDNDTFDTEENGKTEETDYESAYNDYNDKEKFYSDKIAASALIKEELSKAKFIIDAINELTSLDILLNIDESTYESLYFNISDKVEEFISLMAYYETIIKRYNLISEKDLVDKTINHLLEEFNGLSQSYYEEVILIKERINKDFINNKYDYISDEIDDTLTEVKKVISEIGTRINNKDQYHLEMDFYHNTYKIIVEEFDKIYDLADKYSVDSVLKNQNVLKSKLLEIKMLLKKSYSEAKQMSKILKMQLESEELKRKYQELEDKLIRIIDIINRHPMNKKVAILIEHSISLICELNKQRKCTTDSDYSVVEEELNDIKKLIAKHNKKLQYLEGLDYITIQEDFDKVIKKVTRVALDSENVEELIERLVFVKTLADSNITDAIEDRLNNISYNLDVYLESFLELNELLDLLQRFGNTPVSLTDLMDKIGNIVQERKKAYSLHAGFQIGSELSIGVSVIASIMNIYRGFALNSVDASRIVINSFYILTSFLLVSINKKIFKKYLSLEDEENKAIEDYDELSVHYKEYKAYIRENKGYLINYNKIKKELKKVK